MEINSRAEAAMTWWRDHNWKHPAPRERILNVNYAIRKEGGRNGRLLSRREDPDAKLKQPDDEWERDREGDAPFVQAVRRCGRPTTELYASCFIITMDQE